MPYKHNIFLRSPDQYHRDLNIVDNAVELIAHYLQLETGQPIEQCRQFALQKTTVNKKQSLMVKGMKRNQIGDRFPVEIPFDNLLTAGIKSNAIFAPNMVLYDNPSVQVSVSGDYIDNKLTTRRGVKKQGINAYQRNDMATFAMCNNMEYSIKRLTNSISGAHASPHNPLYNKTAHSSLTSNTRTMVSYSNACTEKFVTGNRHYWSKKIILHNIVALTLHTDHATFESIIERYKLHIPTVNELLEMIERSARFYCFNQTNDPDIIRLLTRLSDVEKAIVMYLADFYHLAKYNETLVRSILDEFIQPNLEVEEFDYGKVAKESNSGIQSLAGILCYDILMGKTIGDVEKDEPENYIRYAKTILHIENVGKKYQDLLVPLLTPNVLPSDIYSFPQSIRQSVVGSDTDSTMYTVQNWVEWYYGKLCFGPEVDKLTNAVGYLNNQVIYHTLATISKQMGVSDSNLYRLEMKNEYAFPIYIRTNMAKHYATLMSAREGAVYKKMKIEIKGVGLKNSKIPRLIMNGLEEEIRSIMENILKDGQISIYDFMQKMANLEHFIIESLTKGEIHFLSTQNISTKLAYKIPKSSAYMHYDMWCNVFKHKFGEIASPPYRAIKVSTTMSSAKKVMTWLDTIDPILKESYLTWVNQYANDSEEITDSEGKVVFVNPKKALNQLLLPYEMFNGGLPKEFTSVLNIRDITAELMKGFYIILESLGMYIKNSENTILLSDRIAFKPEAGFPGNIGK